MIKKINEIAAKIDALTPNNKEDVELVRVEYLGKHGVLNKLFDEFKAVSGPEKKEIGKALNELKSLVKSKLLSFSFARKIDNLGLTSVNIQTINYGLFDYTDDFGNVLGEFSASDQIFSFSLDT